MEITWTANANEGGHDCPGPKLLPQVGKTLKTKAAFRFEGRPAYRSDDWIQRIGGEYFFKERIDFQVKIRGFRVELGEVAAAIRSTGRVAVAFKLTKTAAAIVERRSRYRTQ
jgi:hypothetical protein